jgi:2-polyprenyl-3-methyl-5-hydroxy-6-metoxy-1,4-benzoquinol methylase
VIDVEKYRQSESEKARIADLFRIMPRGRASVLEIGARDGYLSRPLAEHFLEVTALDLEKPSFEFPRVTTVAGDATNLQFPDESFDCVLCAEVLEHIPAVEQACRELARVTRHELVIGVPFRQDIRSGRTTCRSCGKTNPPWAHVNSFDEECLAKLFPDLAIKTKSFVGSTKEGTNALSAMLMEMAGNPWGTYVQDEPCIYCGAVLTAPERRSFFSKVCSGIAARLDHMQMRFAQQHANWIHIVFSKDGSAATKRVDGNIQERSER